MSATEIVTDEWVGLYRTGWGRRLTRDSYYHPAKYAAGLISRIYCHLAESLGLPPGSRVLDPFGGVATGAYHAGQYGYRWVGVELEERFVRIGRANLARWRGGDIFAAEAQAVSRFMAFFSMAPDSTPWASAHVRELARLRGLRAMRALLGRLPKGSADAHAAQAWLDFYGREEKEARARAQRIRVRVEESERTPEQAGMIVTRSGDVFRREAFERFARGAAVGNLPPSPGRPRRP